MVIRHVLFRKLLRDLWKMRGQVFAIALVLAGGNVTWIVSFSTLESLRTTQAAFYREQAFADVFAEAVRAPARLLPQLREIPGVAAVEARVRAPATLELEHFDEPVTGLAVSLPEGRSLLNSPWLVRGRLPGRDRLEVLVSDAFAEAHSLKPGDALRITIEGRQARAIVAGIALSPEYIVQIRPGDLFPDYQRYGIAWLPEQQLAAMTDMRGAFNGLAIRLQHGASTERVIARIDRLLEQYGGTGAYARDRQLSHRYLSEEIRQLESMAAVFPLIFMAVAAFLLSLVFNRVIQGEREEIATLKAFGHGNRAIALHYVTMVMLIVLFGSVLGVTVGAWLGSGLAGVYADFYRFPWIDYRLPPATVLSGLLVTALAALFGTWRALKSAWSLTPAVAMRPEAPERYRPAAIERLGIISRASPTTRMIVRHLFRHPWKATLASLGLAMSVAIIMVGSFQEDAIDYMTQVQFGLAAREDLAVQFHHSVALAEAESLARLPGVAMLEPWRAVPATLRHGHRSSRVALQGHRANSHLHRTLDESLMPIALPDDGLLLSEYHAEQLQVKPGDTVEADIHAGSRPSLRFKVTGVVREYIGSGIYLSFDALNRAMGEAPRADGVYLATTGAPGEALYSDLRNMPAVAGVTRRETSLKAFEETMGETILVFAFVNTLLAGSIAFGVIYNSARVMLAERGRELASLRVLGLTRREVSWILSGELLLLALLALPVGLLLGYGLCYTVAEGFTSELYRVPLVVETSTYLFAATVAATALFLSLLIVRHRTNRLDLVGVLKSRE